MQSFLIRALADPSQTLFNRPLFLETLAECVEDSKAVRLQTNLWLGHALLLMISGFIKDVRGARSCMLMTVVDFALQGKRR